jgi:hypothetical protein
VAEQHLDGAVDAPEQQDSGAALARHAHSLP